MHFRTTLANRFLFRAEQSNVDAALKATAATATAYPQLRVEEFGTASANKALGKAYLKDSRTAEFTSLPVTLIILVFAFGALVAAGVPLLLGITAVLAALGLIAAQPPDPQVGVPRVDAGSPRAEHLRAPSRLRARAAAGVERTGA